MRELSRMLLPALCRTLNVVGDLTAAVYVAWSDGSSLWMAANPPA